MLGFAEAVSSLTKYVPYFSGVEGFTLPLLQVKFISTQLFFYYTMGLLALLTVMLAYVIKQTKLGYGFAAIRKDEDASRMIGINTTRYKLVAFILSAVPPALIGAVYAYFVSYVNANSVFPVGFTIQMIVMTLIGGIGTVFGPVIGAGILYLLKTF
ncbi:MAG: branched-chain amino acid ABC transporter permease, partial [Halobacteriaceae archaeon]